MSPTLKSLGIDRLTVDERIALVHEIWESIEEESQPPRISKELAQLLDQRWAEHEANPDDVIPWEVIEADINARLGK